MKRLFGAPIGMAVAFLPAALASALPGPGQAERIDPPNHPHATVVRGAAEIRPKNFGTQDTGVTVVSTFDFHPYDSDIGYGWSGGYSAASGPGIFQLVASLGSLPHGVLLESLTVSYYDTSDTENFRFRACRKSFDAASGTPNSQECFVEFFSSGQPGFASVVLPVPPEFQDYLLVNDTDGDLDDDVVDYFLVVDTPGEIETSTGPVLIRWRRQVSPAPSAATFNDVPTSDPAFQFVEALAASGITAGCGSGIYCPDAPLTRRQMAVFLAKALGLHWAP
jgi:S-layer homology domain